VGTPKPRVAQRRSGTTRSPLRHPRRASRRSAKPGIRVRASDDHLDVAPLPIVEESDHLVAVEGVRHGGSVSAPKTMICEPTLRLLTRCATNRAWHDRGAIGGGTIAS